METLYDRLKPQLKEKLETEVKERYITVYSEIKKELTTEHFINDLKFSTVYYIGSFLSETYWDDKLCKVTNYFNGFKDEI